jgi:hypothetical protein
MHSKVFSDGLPSYINATPPVLEIFKMAGYFSDSRRIFCVLIFVEITQMSEKQVAIKTTDDTVNFFPRLINKTDIVSCKEEYTLLNRRLKYDAHHKKKLK